MSGHFQEYHLCRGIRSEQIERFASSDHSDILKCLHSNFSIRNGVSYSHECALAISKTSEGHDKWKRVKGYLICPACMSKKHNVIRVLNQLNQLQKQHSDNNPNEYYESSDKTKQFISRVFLESLQQNHDRQKAIESFQCNPKVRECMHLLSYRKDTKIRLNYNPPITNTSDAKASQVKNFVISKSNLKKHSLKCCHPI